MKKLLIFSTLTICFQKSYSQTFYLEHETNSRDSTQEELYSVFSASVNWLQFGEYHGEGCSNCQTIDDRYADLKKDISNLSMTFKKKLNNREIVLMNCAETTNEVFKKGDLYYSCIINEIKQNKIVPITKVKVTVTDRIKNNYHQVSKIEIIEVKGKAQSPRSTIDKKYIKAKQDLDSFEMPPIKGN